MNTIMTVLLHIFYYWLASRDTKYWCYLFSFIIYIPLSFSSSSNKPLLLFTNCPSCSSIFRSYCQNTSPVFTRLFTAATQRIQLLHSLRTESPGACSFRISQWDLSLLFPGLCPTVTLPHFCPSRSVNVLPSHYAVLLVLSQNEDLQTRKTIFSFQCQQEDRMRPTHTDLISGLPAFLIPFPLLTSMPVNGNHILKFS